MSTSLAGAQRLQGDFTSYSSQFQSGRTFLSTGSAPSTVGRSDKNGAFPLSATLDQSFAWNRLEFAGADQEALTSTTELSLFSQLGSLENGRLTLDAAGGVTLASTEDFGFSGSGDSAWFMQPGSSLVYERRLGQVTLTVYDRFAARPDALVSFLGPLQGTSLVPFIATMQNDLGMALNWQPLDDLSLTLNYNWASSQSARSSSETPPFNPHGNLDVLAARDINSVLASVAWQASPVMRFGLRAGASWSSFEEEFSNDGNQWHGGLFADLKLPFEQILKLEAGAQGMNFERPEPVGIYIPFGIPSSPASFVTGSGDDRDLGATPYYTLSLGGPLGRRFSHQLSAGSEASLGLLSNYVEARFVNYTLSAQLWKGADLGLGGFYEDVQNSGGVFASDTSVHGFTATLRQTWHRFTFSAGYGHTRFDSDAHPASLVRLFATADQHAFHTSASYQICQRATVSLAWQRIVSDFAAVPDDLVQDRLTMNLRWMF
ncbi:hypothetical protein [Brevifollis gellanilyticus]|uniref:Uncharacterized protein n=1 Tax=Brevifollis gellanilyticus TaxID=748831 RepID=A0A512MBD9_9BACT|nr:hypothetical protein [Brevifollis gellanilyticus]GEP44052.1 hypothetical protein BGE01nite_33430 [Brevifollis gellanilyticus]